MPNVYLPLQRPGAKPMSNGGCIGKLSCVCYVCVITPPMSLVPCSVQGTRDIGGDIGDIQIGGDIGDIQIK